MASEPIPPEFTLDIREQIARIDRIQAEIGKWRVEMAKTAQETRLAPWQIAFTGLGAGAALFAAGAAFMKLVAG